MELIISGGKEYVEVSVLAERFGYAKAYVSDLAKARKIKAQVLKGTLYIELESFLHYRKTSGREVKIVATQKRPPQNSSNILSPQSLPSEKKETPLRSRSVHVPVRPIIKNKTSKLLTHPRPISTQNTPVVRYERDQEALFPTVKKQRLPREEHDGRVVEVITATAYKKHSQFRPEALPEVYLRGSIKVQQAADTEKDTHTVTETRHASSLHSHALVSSEINKREPTLNPVAVVTDGAQLKGATQSRVLSLRRPKVRTEEKNMLLPVGEKTKTTTPKISLKHRSLTEGSFPRKELHTEHSTVTPSRIVETGALRVAVHEDVSIPDLTVPPAEKRVSVFVVGICLILTVLAISTLFMTVEIEVVGEDSSQSVVSTTDILTVLWDRIAAVFY